MYYRSLARQNIATSCGSFEYYLNTRPKDFPQILIKMHSCLYIYLIFPPAVLTSFLSGCCSPKISQPSASESDLAQPPVNPSAVESATVVNNITSLPLLPFLARSSLYRTQQLWNKTQKDMTMLKTTERNSFLFLALNTAVLVSSHLSSESRSLSLSFIL